MCMEFGSLYILLRYGQFVKFISYEVNNLAAVRQEGVQSSSQKKESSSGCREYHNQEAESKDSISSMPQFKYMQIFSKTSKLIRVVRL